MEILDKFKLEAVMAKKYSNKYNNAVKRGIEFTLTIVQYRKLFKTKVCYFTGVPLIHTIEHLEDGIPFHEFTVDRLDSSLGYTKENSVACCHGANALKNVLFESPEQKFTSSQIIQLVSKYNQLKL